MVKEMKLNFMHSYLIIKAAATLRTLGHLISATMVNRLPKIPTIMINIVRMAATVNSGRENLGNSAKKLRIRIGNKTFMSLKKF